MKLLNKTSDKLLAETVEVADTPLKRMKGLLGRDCLPQGTALHIVPCDSIHSFFMKFRFDAVFIDRQNRIKCLVREMPPGRIKLCPGACSVVELPAGILDETATKPGDELEWLS